MDPPPPGTLSKQYSGQGKLPINQLIGSFLGGSFDFFGTRLDSKEDSTSVLFGSRSTRAACPVWPTPAGPPDLSAALQVCRPSPLRRCRNRRGISSLLSLCLRCGSPGTRDVPQVVLQLLDMYGTEGGVPPSLALLVSAVHGGATPPHKCSTPPCSGGCVTRFFRCQFMPGR